MLLNLQNCLQNVSGLDVQSSLKDWLPIIISAILFLIFPLRLLWTEKGSHKKDNFVFWFLLAINTSLTVKLFFEQADAILLSVLVLTTFLLILTLKVNYHKENERLTLKQLEETLENVRKVLNSVSDTSGKSTGEKFIEAQDKLNQIQQIVNEHQDVDWQSMAVFFAILVNNAILFWKLFSSKEPQGGILITIAIMAGLLLLTLRVDSLEFQNKFPFLTFTKPSAPR
jgi:tryptophan-rich sensory protein